MFTIKYYTSLLHFSIATAVFVEIKILNYSHHIDILCWWCDDMYCSWAFNYCIAIILQPLILFLHILFNIKTIADCSRCFPFPFFSIFLFFTHRWLNPLRHLFVLRILIFHGFHLYKSVEGFFHSRYVWNPAAPVHIFLFHTRLMVFITTPMLSGCCEQVRE